MGVHRGLGHADDRLTHVFGVFHASLKGERDTVKFCFQHFPNPAFHGFRVTLRRSTNVYVTRGYCNANFANHWFVISWPPDRNGTISVSSLLPRPCATRIDGDSHSGGTARSDAR